MGTGCDVSRSDDEALRAVFRRVNTLLGTNYSMHDLRHTAALRMSRDESLSMRDVQTILGHAHLSTTADVYLVEDEAQVIRRVRRHLIEREHRAGQSPPPAVAVGYDAGDPVRPVRRRPAMTTTTDAARTRRTRSPFAAGERLLQRRRVGPVDRLPPTASSRSAPAPGLARPTAHRTMRLREPPRS